MLRRVSIFLAAAAAAIVAFFAVITSRRVEVEMVEEDISSFDERERFMEEAIDEKKEKLLVDHHGRLSSLRKHSEG